MDHEPTNRPAPTPEEIARLEAEAVRALQAGGQTPAAPEAPVAPAEAGQVAEEDWSDVPYVDDAEAAARAAKPDAPDADDADYVPSEMEKRIAAIPEEKWKLYTTVGGAVLGVLVIAILMLGSSDLGAWALILAAALALLAPRYAERWWRRPIPRVRTAMLVAMLVSLAVVFVAAGLRNGFRFFENR